MLMVPALALGGCEDTPTPAAVPVSTASSAPQPAPHSVPAGIVLTPQPNYQNDEQSAGQSGGQAGPVLANDPSAPDSTPLCGAAAREINAIGATLLSQQDAQAGICRSFACYDPATATYIGADGYRHVCR